MGRPMFSGTSSMRGTTTAQAAQLGRDRAKALVAKALVTGADPLELKVGNWFQGAGDELPFLLRQVAVDAANQELGEQVRRFRQVKRKRTWLRRLRIAYWTGAVPLAGAAGYWLHRVLM